MRRKGRVYPERDSHKVCKNGKGEAGKTVTVMKRSAVWIGVIFLCAFFSCAGIQMIERDAGVLQMESFRADDGQFLALEGMETMEQQLSELSQVSGIPFEKLVAAAMLKNNFRADGGIRKAEVLSDVLGYERLDEKTFSRISSYYKRMYACVEYLPAADVLTSNGGQEKCAYSAAEHLRQAQMEGSAKTGGFCLLVPVEENWKDMVPAVCMKRGTVVSADSSENTLCLEMNDGVSVVYGNVKQDLKVWQAGDVIESGTILGSVTGAGLLLEFRLLSEDGSWLDFNGYPCLLHGEKEVRSVTRMLQ